VWNSIGRVTFWGVLAMALTAGWEPCLDGSFEPLSPERRQLFVLRSYWFCGGTESRNRRQEMIQKRTLLTVESLAELALVHQPPCLSLCQATHRRHPENQQDLIRFRAASLTGARPRAPQAYSTVRRGARRSATQTCPDPLPLPGRYSSDVTRLVDRSHGLPGYEQSLRGHSRRIDTATIGGRAHSQQGAASFPRQSQPI